jgi:glycerol-3-phosphate dehydrogenase
MDQIKSVFAGLRPLVSTTQNNKRTAAISREHSIIRSPTGLLSIIGGKWTTYRRMGEQVIDALKELPTSPSVTRELSLAGADAARIVSQDSSLDPIASFSEYDFEIQQAVSHQPSLADRLHPSYPYLQAHVVMSARHEMARTVEDVLSRRTRLLLLDANAAREVAPLIAQLLANELGRSEAWQEQQLQVFEKIATGYVVR